MPDTIEAAPVVATPTTEIVNPVIKTDMEVSKSIFNNEMAKITPPAPETHETSVVEPEVKAATPEPTVQTETKGKSIVPQELIDGKAAEVKADDAIAQIDAMVLPKNAKPEQFASFGKLKEHAKKAIEEKLARITELEGKSSDGSTKAEIETALAKAKAAEERAQQLEETLNRTAFEKSDKFKSQFTDREVAAIEGAKSCLEGTEVNPGIIDMALHAPVAKRAQILRDAGVESDIIAMIGPYLINYDGLQRDKAKELDGWKTKAEQMQQEESQKAEQTKAQRTAEEEKVWSSTLSRVEADLRPLRKFDNSPEWNAQGDTIKAEAKKIYNGEGVPLDTLAETITKGVAYDALDGMVTDLIDQLKTAKAEAAKLKSARPAGSDQASLEAAPVKAETQVERGMREFRENMAKVQGTA